MLKPRRGILRMRAVDAGPLRNDSSFSPRERRPASCRRGRKRGDSGFGGTAAMTGMGPFSDFWTAWFVADDSRGILLVTPLVVSWADELPTLPRTPGQGLEAAAFLTVRPVAAVQMYTHAAGRRVRHSGPYLMVALLSWPAMRFGSRMLTCSPTRWRWSPLQAPRRETDSLALPQDSES